MSKKEYASRIDKPTVFTTSKGARFVRPFDILRSESGRATIDRLAKEDSECRSTEKTGDPRSNGVRRGGTDT